MAILTRSQIEAHLESPRIPYADVFIPDWGGSVRVKALSVAEVEGLLKQRDRNGNLKEDGLAARIAVAGTIDETGKPFFTETDVMLLGRQNHRVLRTITDKIKELSGMSEQAVEDAEKN